MRLFIAEKPSVAKAIGEVLGVVDKKNGYLVCQNGEHITWCFGHMLESAEPDFYLPDDIPKNSNGSKIWREEDLPIIPAPGKGLCRLPAKKTRSFYWRCSGYPACTKIYFDKNGKPKK